MWVGVYMYMYVRGHAHVWVSSVPDFECLISHYSCASFMVEVVMKPRCLTCTLLVYQCARTDGYMMYM